MLFALGLVSPLGSLAIVASMLVAIARMRSAKVWITENGLGLALTNAVAALAIALAGPGSVLARQRARS